MKKILQLVAVSFLHKQTYFKLHYSPTDFLPFLSNCIWSTTELQTIFNIILKFGGTPLLPRDLMFWLRRDLTGVGPYTVAELLDDLILPPGEITVQPASWCSFIKLCQSPEVVRGPPRDNSNALVTLTGVSVAPLCPSCMQSFRSPSWIVFSAEIKKKGNAWRSQTSGSNHKTDWWDEMNFDMNWGSVLFSRLIRWHILQCTGLIVLQINCIVFS